MRIIDRKLGQALLANKSIKCGKSCRVETLFTYAEISPLWAEIIPYYPPPEVLQRVFLHGNEIARLLRGSRAGSANKLIAINLCGWPSNTTVCRLRSLLNIFYIHYQTINITKGVVKLRYDEGVIEVPNSGWMVLPSCITYRQLDLNI